MPVPNRKYFATPHEAFDNYRVEMYVQEAYEHAIPKVFGNTGTGPFFEDPFPSNRAYTNAPLNYLVDIHTGGYEYQLINPERDVPNIILYLNWFVDSFKSTPMTPEKQLFFNKVNDTLRFYTDWQERVERAANYKKNKGNHIRTFGEGGYAK